MGLVIEVEVEAIFGTLRLGFREMLNEASARRLVLGIDLEVNTSFGTLRLQLRLS